MVWSLTGIAEVSYMFSLRFEHSEVSILRKRFYLLLNRRHLCGFGSLGGTGDVGAAEYAYLVHGRGDFALSVITFNWV